MLARHFHTALRNIACNRVYLATRMAALAGALMAGSCIYMIRYALDYGGWLPNEDGIFPEFVYRSGDSLLIATMVLHVDVALWHCLAVSVAIFLLAAVFVLGRAVVAPSDIPLKS